MEYPMRTDHVDIGPSRHGETGSRYVGFLASNNRIAKCVS